jgi:exopolyphosphatase/guanosine-5'-triphosphate,3'-diphosphate pyrophosphatase
MPLSAVIDIGTNSALLLIGHRGGDGRVVVTSDTAKITRLGRGAAEKGMLDPEAIRRTVWVLAEFRDLIAEHGAEAIAVATEGLRMAANREDFLAAAQDVLGVPVRLISGDEEAELSYRSVADESDSRQLLRVLDIGGGSTELVSGRGGIIESRRSHPVGSVRFTERFIRTDPPTTEMLFAIEQAVLQAFAAQPLSAAPRLVGLAGTVTTLAALRLDLRTYDRDAVDGSRLSLDQVVELRDALAREPLSRRSVRPCLPPGRADVIVAGASILVAAMRHCGATELLVRDRGLRYALIP